MKKTPIIPLISIVVITWNRLIFTKHCIEAILHTTKDLPCELIVVDNGSTDGTKEYLKEMKNLERITNFHHFRKNKGCGVATNKGMSMCKGEYIVEVDNDIVLLCDWWEKCLDIISDEKIGQIGILPDFYQIKGEYKGINTAVPNVAGAWMIRKEHYDQGARWCEDSWKKTPWQAVLFSAWFHSKGLFIGNILGEEKFAHDQSEGNHKMFPDYYKKTFKERGVEYLLKDKLK